MPGCSAPGVVTRGELVAYADGEAASHVIEHIRRCSACSSETRALAGLQHRLGNALGRFECPAPHEIGEYALGMLAVYEQRLVAAHVVDCFRCAEELQTLRTFLSVEPSPSLGVMERLKRVTATLLSAPRGTLAFAQLRGTEDTAPTEPLIYQAGEATISLSVDRSGARGGSAEWILNGLITGKGGGEGGSAGTRLIDGDGATHPSETDELGNFTYEELRPGTYRLEIDLIAQTVTIEGLRIGDV